MLELFCEDKFNLRLSVVEQTYRADYSFLPRTEVEERERAAVKHLLRNVSQLATITVVNDLTQSSDPDPDFAHKVEIYCNALGYHKVRHSGV